jgi:2,4-dienoyl-CoA reductase-like NADH-dependent reductase (Old Yellow Enzyme family)
MFLKPRSSLLHWNYSDIKIDGIEKIPEAVHRSAHSCKIVAQIWAPSAIGPSALPTPFLKNGIRGLSTDEIHTVAESFAAVIPILREAGFDGVQLHAAHGKSVLCNFLSPYFNHRSDDYGGSVVGRARVIKEIVSKAREEVGDYPILIKMNCTDNLPGGTKCDSFHQMVQQMVEAGIDAIEVSGGTLECLLRSEEELGFPPVVSAESHINIQRQDQQSYYLPYIEGLQLEMPIILVGGNRNIERLEKILRAGSAQFVAMCRPLICEPDLPRRWLEGRGDIEAECISCGSCRYGLRILGHDWPTCFYKEDKTLHNEAQKWMFSWLKDAIQWQLREKDTDQMHQSGSA